MVTKKGHNPLPIPNLPKRNTVASQQVLSETVQFRCLNSVLAEAKHRKDGIAWQPLTELPPF